ncbi:MAG: hypothetical protein IKN54_06760, partial [Lachnospiraceae bacterium]|nr:hypothetical protein [Lachnospiraceae bacterium]
MKKEKSTKLLMLCLFFVVLALVESIIYQLYLSEKNKQDKINESVRSRFIVIDEEESESEEDEEYEYGDESDDSEDDSVQIRADYKKFIFVGDSRYKGMEIFAQEEDIFFAESGRGYDFLLSQLTNIKYNADADTAIIIGLGVNDNL